MNLLKRLFGVAVEVQNDAAFQRGWEQRAAAYARGIKTPYWKGAVIMLPLPAMPGDGSPCAAGCSCKWDVRVINAKRRDYDCYWVLGDSQRGHCQTCLERHVQWAPLRIRRGLVQ